MAFDLKKLRERLKARETSVESLLLHIPPSHPSPYPPSYLVEPAPSDQNVAPLSPQHRVRLVQVPQPVSVNIRAKPLIILDYTIGISVCVNFDTPGLGKTRLPQDIPLVPCIPVKAVGNV